MVYKSVTYQIAITALDCVQIANKYLTQLGSNNYRFNYHHMHFMRNNIQIYPRSSTHKILFLRLPSSFIPPNIIYTPHA